MMQSGFELLSLDPVEVARQLTLIEFNLFKQVDSVDMVDRQRSLRPPFVAAMIDRFNQVRFVLHALQATFFAGRASASIYAAPVPSRKHETEQLLKYVGCDGDCVDCCNAAATGAIEALHRPCYGTRCAPLCAMRGIPPHCWLTSLSPGIVGDEQLQLAFRDHCGAEHGGSIAPEKDVEGACRSAQVAPLLE